MIDFNQLRDDSIANIRKFIKRIEDIKYTSGYGKGYYDACKFILMLLPPEKK